ncbi:MAG: PQQ-binding-like beta-propeller repeat protein [Peptococcaceae bacterium]|nr:PQQ-binding-like beta-propeller repeat protein [Peptococcaceae bacterium]
MLTALKMGKKALVYLFTLLLLVAFTAAPAFAADWPRFQKDNSNSGVVLSPDSPPTGNNPGVAVVDVNEAGFYGIDVPPLIVKEGDYEYAYVLSSENDGTSKVRKYRCSDQSVPNGWTGGVVVDTNGGFQLATPVIVGSTMYLGISDMAQKLLNTGFDSSTANWTTYVDTPTTTIAWDAGGGDGCVRIDQSAGGTLTKAGVYQQVTLDKDDKVRMSMRIKFLKGSGANNPTALKGRVLASNDGGNTWTSMRYVSFSYTGDWSYVNTDVTPFFPFTGNETDDYLVKFQAEFTSGSGSTAYALVDDCRLYAENLKVKKITGIDGSNPTVSSVADIDDGGQFNTPLLYDDGYLYLGSWKGGSTVKGRYYKIDASDGDVTTFTPPDNGDGFYWAGAAVVGNYLVFGGDISKVFVVNKSNMNSVASYNIKNNEASAAEIRSSILYRDIPDTNNDKIYFTDKGGFLWCLSLDSSNGTLNHLWHQSIGYSTSTPVYYDGKIYVGKGSVGSSGGAVYCVDADTGTVNWSYTGPGDTLGGVQSSPVVYYDGTNKYIYFTTNCTSGKGYCIRDDGNSASLIWSSPSSPPNNSFTLQGMAASGEYVVWGNDLGTIYFAN